VIPAERIERLARHLVGEADSRPGGRKDPVEDLPYPPDLDLEDRATVLRLWSGEAVAEPVGRIERGTPIVAVTEILNVLRDVIVDHGGPCSPRLEPGEVCPCSTARAVRLLAGYGIVLEEATS
jgi:hypothetical protein